MQNLIEPNLHPIFVHFVIGLLFTAAVALAVVAFTPARGVWRASLQHAGDWMLLVGLVALAAAVAAGFEAYYTVAHDGPSHASMTTHRNWALATGAVFLGLGVWRWMSRGRPPSAVLAVALLVGAGLLTTTAWWGGRLVFHHGLGVASLPAASGPGHHHDGEGHGDHAHDDHEHGDHAHDDQGH
ncbi:MAG: DUF2231 domain-containing protein [Alphaproteobacteria bacterium]|nr:MAG: DUF2231 domain-containing protein [Alphaproteobacteria bacterium]